MAPDKITSLLAALPPHSPYFSLEFFPPKTQAGFTNLQARLGRMSAALKPLFVTVTWGAGGSTAAKSLELAEICQRQLGLTTCLHLTCTNTTRRQVDEALAEARALGIRNILALRGDPPRPGEYRVPSEEREKEEEEKTTKKDEDGEGLLWAVDLVRYIRQKHGNYFCIGVAGYPEGHADESWPERGRQSVQRDLPYLVEKVRAGADFIMTQLTYDIDAYRKYEEVLRGHESGVFKTIPIIPGLMPIQSYQIVKRITKLSHAGIPEPIMQRIERVKSDDEAVKKVGVDVLSELVEQMKTLPRPAGQPRGFHFYTLNLEKSVAFILERCHLIPPDVEEEQDETDDEDMAVSGMTPITNGTQHQPRFSRRRASSMNTQPHNRVIIDRPRAERHQNAISDAGSSDLHEALDREAGIPASETTRSNHLLISEGHGALGREATWDDFPNGRWGPSHSPAFGEIDGYGPSLKVGPATARRLWGHPTRREDITNLFRRHVLNELECVPWSDEIDLSSSGSSGALRAETDTIRTELLSLINDHGLWTLASQPAVNGVRSDDPIFGWGPPGEGFVFQKAFVEFFCPRPMWENHLKPHLRQYPEDELSWLKTDTWGRFESSTTTDKREHDMRTSKPRPGQTGINAVTWGVFRGKEIITPTIIEEMSFRAWGEEAYGIWEEWRNVFARGSKEEAFLRRCKEEVVLVNVVGQKFLSGEGGRLWEILSTVNGGQEGRGATRHEKQEI